MKSTPIRSTFHEVNSHQVNFYKILYADLLKQMHVYTQIQILMKVLSPVWCLSAAK